MKKILASQSMSQPLGSEETISEFQCSRFNLAQLGSVATLPGVDVPIKIGKAR